MADKYCDSTAYTYAATPTWGVAQEGDGTATGAATPATVSIDLSAATAGAGDTISVLGATLTCVASGATTNQFNAGSGATLVSNLVTAINRTTNTSTVAAQDAGWATPKLQDAVFARIGSPTTTLEIMTRAGSAVYNSSLVAQAGIAGVTGPWTFSGGAGGAWGWIFNVATIWPSGITAGLYGLWSTNQPLAGAQIGGDVVYIRANNQSVLLATNVTVAPPATVGSAYSPVTHRIDSGNKWSGDSASATLTLGNSSSGSGTPTFNFSLASVNVVGKKIGTKLWNLKFENSSGTGATILVLSCGGYSRLAGFNAEVVSASLFASVRLLYVQNPTAGTLNEFEDFTMTAAATGSAFIAGGSSGTYLFSTKNGTLRNTGAVAIHTGVFDFTANALYGNLSGITLEGFVVGSRLFTSNLMAVTSKITLEDCAYGNVTDRGPVFGTGNPFTLSGFVASYSKLGDRDGWLDNHRGLVEWNSAVSQPTLRAVLLDGVTQWSWKLLPVRSPTNINPSTPLKTLPAVKTNSLATGARTFTAEFCISDTLAWTKSDVSIVVSYRDASGDTITLRSFDPNSGALTSSSQTWSAESGGQVTYSSGGTLYHDKFKLQVSTPAGSDLPLGEEVTFEFCVNSAVDNTTQFIFVDPDLDIA